MPNYRNFDYDTSTYRTGSTRPPKSYGSIIALLLVLVIALCGVISILSMANIRLTRKVRAAEEQNSLTIIHANTHEKSLSSMDAIRSGNNIVFPIGITGESVSTLYQLYYGLPGGILVSASSHASVAPGDILLRINGVDIPDTDTLSSQLSVCVPGDTLSADFYRNGEVFSVTLILEGAED